MRIIVSAKPKISIQNQIRLKILRDIRMNPDILKNKF